MDLQHLRASDGTGEAVLAHIQSVRNPGSAVLDLDNVDNWNSKCIVLTGTPAANGFISPVGMKVMYGHLNAGDFIIDGYAPGYADNGNTTSEVAIVKMTTSWADTLVTLLQNSLADDGKLKPTSLDHFFKLSDVVHNSVVSGGFVSLSSGLVGTFSNIEYYINGLRYTKSSIPNKTYTANRDTYVDINIAGNVTYVEVANGATSGMTLTANSIRVAKVVTNGSTIIDIVRFGYDPIGNLIYPLNAVGAQNIDFNSFLKPKRVQGSNQSLAQPGTYITTTYTFAANVPHLMLFNCQQASFNNTGSVWQFDIRVDGTAVGTSRSEGNGQHPQPIIGLYTPSTTASRTVTLVASRVTGGAAVDIENPVLMIIPLPAIGTL